VIEIYDETGHNEDDTAEDSESDDYDSGDVEHILMCNKLPKSKVKYIVFI